MTKIAKPVKRIIKAVLFLLIFALLFLFAQRLLQAKWADKDHLSTNAWHEYESMEKNSVDVLYFGTSQVYSGVDPMVVYEQTGITSFVISVGGMRWDLACAALQAALQTQSPKVVMADMSMIRYPTSKEEERIRPLLDQLPLSVSKVRYVLNLETNDMSTISAMFPLLRYHSRWDELDEEDFKYAVGDQKLTVARGHLISFKIVGGDHYNFYNDPDGVFEIPERAWTYLQEFAKICEENDIELLLFKLPALNWKYMWSAASERAAEELDVTFWDMFYDIDEMHFDSTVDFRDNNKHMNQYGANIVSGRIGEYLQENYDLPDQRGSNARWDDDLVQYHEELGFNQ